MLVRCVARCSTNRICCPRPGWSRWSRWPTGWVCRTWRIEFLTVPTDKGANAGLKVTSLVAGMVAGRGQHRRHGDPAARRDAPGLRCLLCPIDSRVVPADVPVRSCPATGRGRVPDADRAGPAGAAAAGYRRVRAGRHGRLDHRGPRLRQAGRRVRLHQGAGTELLHRHGQHHRRRRR